MSENNKRENKKITWKDGEAQKLFLESGFAKFADFLNLKTEDNNVKLQSMREHFDKSTGEVNRKMTRIQIGEQVYYLKKACKEAFINIVNEFDAIDILPEFDLIPPQVSAYSIDEEDQEGFIILKELKGYYSIKEIIEGNASKQAIEDFISRKEEILKKIADIIRGVHKKGYAYPDWFAKHIYIQEGSEGIVLIDLERFRPLKNCPWYFGFPITSTFVKKKFWRKLRRSLKSEMLPDDLLKRILHE